MASLGVDVHILKVLRWRPFLHFSMMKWTFTAWRSAFIGDTNDQKREQVSIYKVYLTRGFYERSEIKATSEIYFIYTYE